MGAPRDATCSPHCTPAQLGDGPSQGLRRISAVVTTGKWPQQKLPWLAHPGVAPHSARGPLAASLRDSNHGGPTWLPSRGWVCCSRKGCGQGAGHWSLLPCSLTGSWGCPQKGGPTGLGGGDGRGPHRLQGLVQGCEAWPVWCVWAEARPLAVLRVSPGGPRATMVVSPGPAPISLPDAQGSLGQRVRWQHQWCHGRGLASRKPDPLQSRGRRLQRHQQGLRPWLPPLHRPWGPAGAPVLRDWQGPSRGGVVTYGSAPPVPSWCVH